MPEKKIKEVAWEYQIGDRVYKDEPPEEFYEDLARAVQVDTVLSKPVKQTKAG